MMAGPLASYLQEDHARIEGALHRATSSPGQIDSKAYTEFRGLLLRHIGMEEKILLPAARAAVRGSLIGAEQLHLDHGALAALLVPTPTRSILRAIRMILDRHNTIEEGPEGVYAQCERIPELDVSDVLAQLRAAPPVRMAPHADSSVAMESMRDAVRRAGYQLEL